jgi:hypothetical protein
MRLTSRWVSNRSRFRLADDWRFRSDERGAVFRLEEGAFLEGADREVEEMGIP